MAGSYQHCIGWVCPDDGEKSGPTDAELLTAPFDFTCVENMGDAYEACEMMVDMIRFLANGDARRIKNAQEAYYRKVRSRYVR